MDASLARLALFVALAAALLLAAGFASVRVARALRGMRARARMRRAQRGEHAARGLLVSRGFEVTSEQAPGRVVLRVDGEETFFAVRADYLVRRRGRSFVAEVKTGARAPSLDHGPTRRQLLEYASAFAVDGVLLVDPEARTVREVAFGPERPSARWPFASGLVLGLAISAAVLLIAALTSP